MKNKKYRDILKGDQWYTFPREERDPFLVNTDMINGMSGGPLFNRNGKIIGIGSTVKKNGLPLDYDPRFPAIFSKAKYISTVIDEISKQENYQ